MGGCSQIAEKLLDGIEVKPGDEAYYPVNNAENQALYLKYRVLADREQNVVFGGRLGEYKYYDMDKVIVSALAMAEKEFSWGVPAGSTWPATSGALEVQRNEEITS